MARYYINGFETGDASELASLGSGRSIVSGGRYGAYCLRTTDTTFADVYLINPVPNSPSRMRMRFALRWSANTTGSVQSLFPIFAGHVSNGTGFQIYFNISTSGEATLLVYGTYDPIGGTSVFLESVVLTGTTPGTWINVEVDATPGNTTSSGAIQVWIDGVSKSNLTGKNLGSINTFTYVMCSAVTNASVYYELDDLVLDDAVMPGIGGVIARQPKTGGTPTYDSWSKSSGSDAGALWDNTPFDTTDRAYSAVADAAQTAQIASFSSTQTGHGTGTVQAGGTINAIKGALVAKTAATTAAGITQVGTALGGSSTSGADVTLNFTDPQAGDLIIVTGGGIYRSGVSYGPSGYTAIGSLQTSGSSGTGIAFGAWYKVSDGTEVDVTCRGTGSTGDGIAYTVRIFQQTDTGTPLDVAATFAGPTTSTNPDPPASGTLVTNNCAIVAAGASLVSDTSIGGATNYTAQASGNANATRPYSTSSLHRILSGGAGGTENPNAIGSTGNSWASGIWFAVTIAIRPAAAAGSAASIRRRLGGSNTDTSITLTTSDAYYETGIFTDNITNLNAAEIGALHGNTSLLQTVEDAWIFVDYTPGNLNKFIFTSQAGPTSAFW